MNDRVLLFTFLFITIAVCGIASYAQKTACNMKKVTTGLRMMNAYSSWLLTIPCAQITLSEMAAGAVRILSLEYCAIHVHTDRRWHHYSAVSRNDISAQTDSLKIRGVHPTSLAELAEEQTLGVRYAQIRRGSELFAVLAVKGGNFPAETIDTLANVIGLRRKVGSSGPAAGISAASG